MIDLRSDTVTRPGAGMRAAMMDAPLGDDVWGDDPTALRLEAVMAERTGKEAALFFPSGTQSNLAAILSHCTRGEEAIVGRNAHVYRHEAGGASALGGVVYWPIDNDPDGSLPLAAIASAVKPDDSHYPPSRLLCLENTINGQVLAPDYVAEATALARSLGLATHLDGARGFNAAVAGNRSIADVAASFDSVSLCFSKGLGTPAGTVLVGSRPLIARARRLRKMLGGGMRQVGLLAGACLYALDHNVARLAEDHAHAALLAEGLSGIDEVTDIVQATNMVFARFPEETCTALKADLARRGILADIKPRTRFVTHLDVSATNIAAVVTAIGAFFAGRSEGACPRL